MDYKIGIIANPKAGRGLMSFNPVLAEATRTRHQGRIFVHISTDLWKMSAILREMVNKHKIDVLMVYGGDGTLHKVVDCLIYEHDQGKIKRIPLVFPLGGGTMKAVFKWLGWSGSPADIFRKAIETPLERLPARRLRPLKISFWNQEKDRQECHYGFMFIMGAVTRVITRYDKEKSFVNGLKHTFYGATAGLFGWPRSHHNLVRQFRAKLIADDTQLKQDKPLSVVCSACESLLFGFEPFKGKAAINQFYSLAYSIPVEMIVSMLPLLARGTFVPKGNLFFNKPTFCFSIIPTEENIFFIDGDFFHCEPGKEVKVTLGPEMEMVSFF